MLDSCYVDLTSYKNILYHNNVLKYEFICFLGIFFFFFFVGFHTIPLKKYGVNYT